jgi:hypothetical protein
MDRCMGRRAGEEDLAGSNDLTADDDDKQAWPAFAVSTGTNKGRFCSACIRYERPTAALKGYRDHDTESPRRIFISGQKRGVFGVIKRDCDDAPPSSR